MAEPSTPTQLSIPIPLFPPFKLRSSLIDKDPVIWEYLLADYIDLFKKLIALSKSSKNQSPPYTLSTKTVNQLHQFLKSFIHESSYETKQVFSLGAINPNIRENQHILKIVVFVYIKSINLVNLKLTGESTWEFCKVYITLANKYTSQRVNQALVTIPNIRKLVEGTIKSNYSSKSDDISLIRSLQDYLGKVMAGGKWSQEDTTVLYSLLGQRTKSVASTSDKKNRNFKINSKRKNNGNDSSIEFASTFVDKHWIEILEEVYSNGEGMNSKVSVQLMILSLCSLSSARILRLLKDQLEIDGLTRIRTLYPLVSCVVLSKKFNDMYPDLKDILSSLFVQKKQMQAKPTRVFDDVKVSHVMDMFPQLSTGQIKTLLVENNDDVETVIDYLLSHDMADLRIDDFDVIEKGKDKKLPKDAKKASNVFEFEDEDKTYMVQMGKKEESDNIENPEEDFRKKNLQRALSILYNADEDEPDDTYIDYESITGKPESDEANSSTSNVKLDAKLLQIESTLFGIYRTSPEKLTRNDRNTQFRQSLKNETAWTDEQIEGWARVLQKSPTKYRMLEERLVFVDGSLNKSGKKSSKWVAKKPANSEDGNDGNTDSRGKHLLDKRKGGYLAKVDANGTDKIAPKNKSNFNHYMAKKKAQKAAKTQKTK
ncbi:unnamed protein product [Pichia kudriavzevii]